MLKLTESPQVTLLDAMLPPEFLVLNDEQAKIDAILNDHDFLEPFIKQFNTRIGRPTVPVETYLRLMYLKSRYQLGYEVLVNEVSDSIKWRHFCKIPLDKKVPHSTTLIKLTKRYGSETVDNLNRILVEKARDKKIIRARKLRLDTTTVESDIHYPTDASLLADGIRVITRTVKKIKESGAAIRTEFQNRNRSTKRRILSIVKVLKRRSGEAYQEVRNITETIMDNAQATVDQAENVLCNARQYIYRQKTKGTAQIEKMVKSLEQVITVTKKILGQTAIIQQGNTVIPNRIVSIFDQDARPIKRGKLKAPTEFGYKLLLAESEERIITDYQVCDGNSADETLLVPSIDRNIEIFGRPPWGVATDRGFGNTHNDEALKERSIKRCSLPRKGKINRSRKEFQSQFWFKRLQAWRAGGEATISVLKRKYGLGRSLSRGAQGTKTWVGFGILTYNLRRIAALS